MHPHDIDKAHNKKLNTSKEHLFAQSQRGTNGALSRRVCSINWEVYIADGIAALPERFRKKINNVALLLEDKPSREVRRREGLNTHETLLGYYHGIPLSERGEHYGVGETLPDTITLYRLPILEEAGGDPERVHEVVIETIWHEFGHYFGLDEDEVRQREAERFPER